MGTKQDPEAGAPAVLRLVQVTDAWAMGELGPCLAVVWRGQPTPEAFRLRNSELVALSRRNPGRCALVEIIEPTSKPPADETRKVAMEVFRTLATDLSGVGFVLEGSALRSAVTRAILTGMTFFVKQQQPTKMFKRVADMAEWVRPRVFATDPAFTTQLAAALEHLRQLIGTAPTP